MSAQPIIRVGVVGYGNRGRYLAANYSQSEHPGFQLAAACDTSPQRLRLARQEHGDALFCTEHWTELLARADIDAVVVATHDHQHLEPTLAALAAGKHVICEKPLCQSAADAAKVVEAVRRSGRVFMIGFELRHCAVFTTMRRLLDEGRIGEVKVAHVFDNVSVGGSYYFHRPRRKAQMKSLLLQKASHSLDLLNGFAGSRPVKVYGIGGQDFYGRRDTGGLRCRNCGEQCPYRARPRGFQPEPGAPEIWDYCVWSREMDLNDNSELCISYANGVKATFHECHFTPDYSREFWLVGTRGKMYGYYDGPGRFLVRIEYANDPDRRTEEFKPPRPEGGHGGSDGFLRDECYRRIVAGASSEDALHSAYYSTALAACAEESIESGLPVAIPPMPQE